MAKEKRKKGKLTGILRMPKGSDKILHFTVLALVLFGSVMIVDINVGQTSSNNMVVITTAVKQGLFMIAGYVAMLFAAKVFEFNWFYRLSKVIIIAMTVLLILPFFSIEQGGSNAWIYITIGSQVISLQPSEFVKPLMIVLIATYVYAAQYHKGMQKSAWKMLRVPIICFVLFSVIILAQRDIGALAILFLICAGAIQPVAYPKLRKLQVAARAAVLIGFVLVFIGMSPIGLPIVEKMADLPLLGHIAARFVNAADPTALDMYGVTPDIVIGCCGGGSNFGGLIAPFMADRLEGKNNITFVGVEPASCPSLTRGRYAYDFCDTGRMTPLAKMYTLGSDFIPSPNHAGGLRYHGMSPIVSKLYHDGYITARSVTQTDVFKAAELFARTEGTFPAPESSHAIAAAIDEALKCKESGESKDILFGLTGTGYFDMAAYKAYNDGAMTDYIPTDADLKRGFDSLPKVE